jgi:hypothetical protein
MRPGRCAEGRSCGPGITDDERRTIVEMMAKGTYGWIIVATTDLDDMFERLQVSDAEVVQEPGRAAVPSTRLRLSRSRGQPDPHPRAALRVRCHELHRRVP